MIYVQYEPGRCDLINSEYNVHTWLTVLIRVNGFCDFVQKNKRNLLSFKEHLIRTVMHTFLIVGKKR